MTPGEFYAVVRGKVAEARRLREQADQLNAVQCLMIASAAGAKDAKMEQFMIYKEMKPKKRLSEAELERKLMRIGGGVVCDR